MRSFAIIQSSRKFPNLQYNPLLFCRMNAFDLSIIVEPVLSIHSKLDKTKLLKTDDISMPVESIAECSLEALCNTFDLH